jgi:hypothetical protein
VVSVGVTGQFGAIIKMVGSINTVSRLFPVLFLLMSLAVATREIPELYNLADDPSNDGQVFDWQGPTAVCTTQHIENGVGTPQARSLIFSHIANCKSTSVVSAKTGQDILHFIGSLRT